MTATVHNLGRVTGELAEAYAYVLSPAAIEGELRRHAAAIAAGDTSPATLQLLADWEEVKRTQARLVGGQPQQTALDLAGAMA